MKIKTTKIVPLSQKNIYSRQGGCGYALRAWVLAGAKLGRPIQRLPVAPTYHELNCRIRFSFQDLIQRPKEFTTNDFWPTTIEEARFQALAIALDKVRKDLGCSDFEQLRDWKIGILSTRPEFLKDIETGMAHASSKDEFYFGHLKHPIKSLRHFKDVELLQIDRRDAHTVFNSDDFVINWN